ncbi:MAG: NUDIX hydrolase [Cellulosilyticum sp.]|nr:NUDIX hydrolase [Cellulosilyticum sp.]
MKYKEAIMAYKPVNEQEEAEKRVILQYINEYPHNILLRENEFGHMTSSGFIMNKDLTKVLMIHHNIYNTWAWTGGHADGDEDLLYVAMKEAKEETGVEKIEPLMEEIASIDILPVWGHMKKGKYVATHMHLSVAYILIADEDQALHINEDENSGVKWIAIEDIEKYSNETEIISIYHKLIQKAKAYVVQKLS